MLQNKFRCPTVFVSAAGHAVREADVAINHTAFPRSSSFEVSFICYGSDHAMLAPTTVHSRLDSGDLPSADLVVATIAHFLALHTHAVLAPPAKRAGNPTQLNLAALTRPLQASSFTSSRAPSASSGITPRQQRRPLSARPASARTDTLQQPRPPPRPQSARGEGAHDRTQAQVQAQVQAHARRHRHGSISGTEHGSISGFRRQQSDRSKGSTTNVAGVPQPAGLDDDGKS